MRTPSLSTPEKWRQVEDLFHQASLLNPKERTLFLEHACGTDRELRAEVESLLESEQADQDVLASAIQGTAAAYLVERTAPLLSAGMCVEFYRIQGLLGTGGMGSVYLAEDTKLQRKVAIKALAPSQAADASAIPRLRHEAQTLSGLNHPNLLTVFDLCSKNGSYFLVTEYVEGETLRTMLNRGPLPCATALDIASQIALALRAAHGAGVVHRDIKPENIMVRPDGCVKVLDFGIAELSERNASGGAISSAMYTSPAALLGTPRYMSPEHARGLPVDGRSDLFSLGAVLYEMLVGKPAFDGKTESDIIAGILHREPAPVHQQAAGVSRNLAKIVHRALAKDREQRYQQAAGLLDDLQRYRASLEYRSTRQPRVLSWAIGLLILGAVIGGSLWFRSKPGLNAPPTMPRVLAVLPFRNLQPGPDADFLGYSLAEEVTSKLAYVKALTLRPAAAAFRYRSGQSDLRAIAKSLNADLLLTGTYGKSGGVLQIAAQLNGVNPPSALWRDELTVPYGNLATVHARVAAMIIQRLQLPLGPDETKRLQPEPKADPVAYEYFLRGIDLYAASNFQGAIEMLQKSAAIQTDYAPAWARLGRAYTTHASLQFGGRDDYRRAEAAYQKAISADPFSPEPRIYMANLFTDTGRVEEAVPLLRVALESSPNNAEAHWELGYAFRYGGMLRQSVAECELARRLDPEVKINSATLNSYLYLGEYNKFLGSLPSNDSALLVFYQGLTLYYLHRLQEAAGYFDRAYELSPDLIQAQIGKAMSDGLHGRVPAGLEQLRQTERKMRDRGVSDPEAVYKIAQAYAALGDRQRSLVMLERSITGGFFPYAYISRDPLLRSLHDVAAFPEVLARAHARQVQFQRRFSPD